ncbi:hypothetical protein PROFUN_08093 [Planoprotostelium fungivorum]|uniref:Uncharacterized protein n=1 Tax=Planoprotostelium fungivorum TaxID=1890364 RepID=A0A2P6NKC8_9EUKA|nr:hypothetical protein PROFUN_08093 [Planoprotostelium fungivorum]
MGGTSQCQTKMHLTFRSKPGLLNIHSSTAAAMNSRIALLLLATIVLSSASSLTLVNNCGYTISVCGRYLGHVFDMPAHTRRGVAASGNPPYNQCGSVQAEFNFNGWGNQDCYDLSEVAVKFRGAPVTIFGQNGGPTVRCKGTPCSDAYQWSSDDKKNHCVRTGGNYVLQGISSSFGAELIKFRGAPVAIFGRNGGPTVHCSGSPCGDAYQWSSGDKENHCVGTGGNYIVQWRTFPAQLRKFVLSLSPFTSNSFDSSIRLPPFCLKTSKIHHQHYEELGGFYPLTNGGAITAFRIRRLLFQAAATMNSRIALLLLATIVLSSASSLTLVNNCGYTISVCGRYLGHVFDMPAYTRRGVDASGNPPYNQCGSVQAEFNFNGWGNQDCYDLSEVAVRFAGAPVTIFGQNGGPTVHCSGSPCGDAYNYPSDNSKNHCVGTGGNYVVQWC